MNNSSNEITLAKSIDNQIKNEITRLCFLSAFVLQKTWFFALCCETKKVHFRKILSNRKVIIIVFEFSFLHLTFQMVLHKKKIQENSFHFERTLKYSSFILDRSLELEINFSFDLRLVLRVSDAKNKIAWLLWHVNCATWTFEPHFSGWLRQELHQLLHLLPSRCGSEVGTVCSKSWWESWFLLFRTEKNISEIGVVKF